MASGSISVVLIALCFFEPFTSASVPTVLELEKLQLDPLKAPNKWKNVPRWKRQGFQFNGNGQEDTDGNSPGCVVHCLTVIAKGAMMNGQMNGTAQNPMDSGTSLLCTKYDERGLEEVCKSYNEGTACFNKCSDSPMKSITMTGFTFLQFVCGDRRKDFDKALPCIGDSCAEAERTCKPSCGMVKTGTKENLGKAFGELTNATSISDFANVDLFGIQKTIAENCRYASCYMNCSRPSLAAKCGERAYSLYEELIWKLISSATQSFQDLGLGSVWPQECKTFTRTYDVQHASTSSAKTPAVKETKPTEPPSAAVVKCNNATCGVKTGTASTAVSDWATLIISAISTFSLIRLQ